jgi:ATP-dependent helicase/nuclease subunit A
MSDYLADAQPVSGDEFVRRASDPQASAVVEACAGSGKTWLLVGRIVRALLAGSSPGEILAITFTRRAAQEMRTRLMDDLKSLALADDEGIVAWLCRRGMAAEAAREAIAPARSLYERVAMARVSISMETFHGWFWQLVGRAPLGAGVPYAPALLENVDRLRADAWLHFCALLLRPEHSAQRAAWERMLDDLGEDSARRLLMQFLGRRAEWWCFAAGDETAAVERALAPMRTVGEHDPCADVRAEDFVEAVRTLSELWASRLGALKTARDAVERAQRWLESPPGGAGADFRAACLLVLTKGGQTPIQALQPEKVGKRLVAADEADRYAQAMGLVVGRLEEMKAERRIWQALRMNEAAFACGRLLVDAYQRLKSQQQALDFTDLEWHAHRLLADPDHAAYLQVRLDARYRHILVDEFQDTNPLQWQVLQSWLASYGEREPGGEDDRPRVFVVGDPKQSIYRFRRAEPRVFDAARELLRRDFGAVHLRTNVTRRNARRVLDVLDRVMTSNPLYQPQSTLAQGEGAFVLLPPSPALPAPEQEDAVLRDVLATPRLERDTENRYREGRALANEILDQVARLRVRDADGERAARFADVLLLVRRRTHLAQYERALRDAGVPYVSDRRGGLLATLEADDLTALLGFLTSPSADLMLAHALRSPVFGAADEDLIRLARAAGASWWQRLLALHPPAEVRQKGEAGPMDEPLARAARLLARWLDAARVLPVHDLLDRIYFEGDLRRRYATAAPAAMHAQVQANLDAFIELALAIDAGRYPSLPRFIDELAGLKRHAPEEAPDEGPADAGDAVRVMTIHGAKGLEAEIVLLADTHARERNDAEGVLVVWPPDAPAPEHVSLVARGEARRDEARAAWFADDDAQREQEDWNLMYVAATRARQVFVASGAEGAQAINGDTWYTRLAAAADLSIGAAEAQPARPSAGLREVRDFLPPPLPTGRRLVEEPDSDAQRLGRGWHALLEQGRQADLAVVARTEGLDALQAARAAAAAARVRECQPQFFSGGELPELELIDAEGQMLRVDRLCEVDGALWVVDFKWRVTDAELPQYEAQVRRYGQVLQAIYEGKPLRLGLVTAEGELIVVEPAPTLSA